MSNTEWQRGTADMQKAGINPMLAFMKGGASTPTGAGASSTAASGPSAQAVTFQRQNPGMAAMMAGQAAMSNANQAADIELKRSQADKNYADASMTRQETYIRSYTASTAEQFNQVELGIKRETEQLLIAQTGMNAANAGLLSALTTKAAKETDLRDEEIKLVQKQIINAVKTGRNIDANTDNTKANEALTRVKEELAKLSRSEAFANSDFWDEHGSAPLNADYKMRVLGGTTQAIGNLVNSASQAQRAFRMHKRTTINNGNGIRTEYDRYE